MLIPHPVRRVESPDAPMNRSRFGIPDDHYVFLTIAASTSSFVRKNPLGSLHAFRAAFPHGQTDAILAIKLLASSYNPSAEEQRELFSTDPAFGDDVILIIEAFTASEMTELVKCCDAFVSLHRAEGFGLGAAEAMSLGKPVIVTNWSGPVDFLTPENSLPVPYELVTIDDPGMDFYLPGLEWAEPDLSVAASHMRLVVDDPALGEALGRRAKTDIERRHSIDAAGATMAARLRQLHGS
jgi:glycosyltransferase involved in cell wall biosynthesis